MDKIGKNLPAISQGAGIGMDIAGNLSKARAYSQAGQQAVTASGIEAGQYEANANTAIGASQLAALEQKRQGDIQASRALAVAAASGGGASDPTVINLMARMAGESHFRQMSELYQGQSQAQALNYKAQVARYAGAVDQYNANESAKAERFAALNSAIKGAGSLYANFGMNKPGKAA